MIIVNAQPGKALYLGKRGENLVRRVVFDISAWQRFFGEGVAQLIAQRMGDGIPYPCNVKMDGDKVFWDITEVDVDVPGNYGKCELSYYIGDRLIKSEIYQTIVFDSMGAPSDDMPEAYEGWLEEILAAGAKAEGERMQAEAAREGAEASASHANEYANAAEKSKKESEEIARGIGRAVSDGVKAIQNEGGVQSDRVSQEGAKQAESLGNLAENISERIENEADSSTKLVKDEGEKQVKALDAIAELVSGYAKSAEDSEQDAKTYASNAAKSADDAAASAKYVEDVIKEQEKGRSGLLFVDTYTGNLFRLQVTNGNLRMVEVPKR